MHVSRPITRTSTCSWSLYIRSRIVLRSPRKSITGGKLSSRNAVPPTSSHPYSDLSSLKESQSMRSLKLEHLPYMPYASGWVAIQMCSAKCRSSTVDSAVLQSIHVSGISYSNAAQLIRYPILMSVLQNCIKSSFGCTPFRRKTSELVTNSSTDCSST